MVSLPGERTVHVLLLSQGRGDLQIVGGALRRRGVSLSVAGSLAEALAALEARPAALAVVHPTTDAGLEILIPTLLAMDSTMRVLAVGPADNADLAVAAMKLGAADYLSVPIDEARAERALDTILMGLILAAETEEPCSDDEVLCSGRPPVVLVGQSPAIVNVRHMIRQVALSRASVLITGDTGTGKEIVASAIHRLRHGPKKPFVAVNCAQLSGSIMESQLFGHVKGAFTGAAADSLGFFRAAEGGTLFLDEVSEMSSDLQAKLLRAIQQREVIPVGATQALPVNVDIVAATNRDPLRAMEENSLRKDLYYRLAEVSLHLPPLKDRAGDVAHLVRWFITRFSQDYGRRPKRLEPGVIEFLLNHDWPGNVRELENVVHRVFTFGKADTAFGMALVAQHVDQRDSAARPSPRVAAAVEPATAIDDVLPLADVERDAIARALVATGGNVSQAARLLGIERHRLARRIKTYGLDRMSKTDQPSPAGTLCSTFA
jgi:DNA-binding NtrC family response regulator